MKRANIRKSSASSLGAWIPSELLALLEQAAESTGTDRSEFVRRALKEKVEKTKVAGAPAEEKP